MSQPSNIDVLTPFDPTGYLSISGAQLEQFGSGIIPFTDKGLVVVSTDIAGVAQVPNATITTKWQNYIWVRQSATSVSMYAWAVGGATDATFLNWVSANQAGIGVGSITGTMIASNTITPANISSVNFSQISGVPSGFAPSGAAGGILAGTYPNPTITANGITGAMIALGSGGSAITGANINPLSVGIGVLTPNGLALTVPQTNAGATAVAWVLPSSIWLAANGVTTSAAQFTIPQVATSGVGDTGTWRMVSPATLIQSAQVSFVSAPTALSSGSQLINAVHGLGAVPHELRAVMVCVNNDASTGYSVGDEVDVFSFHAKNGTDDLPGFSLGASTTNVFIAQSNLASTALETPNKTSGVISTISAAANWNVKIYARL